MGRTSKTVTTTGGTRAPALLIITLDERDARRQEGEIEKCKLLMTSLI